MRIHSHHNLKHLWSHTESHRRYDIDTSRHCVQCAHSYLPPSSSSTPSLSQSNSNLSPKKVTASSSSWSIWLDFVLPKSWERRFICILQAAMCDYYCRDSIFTSLKREAKRFYYTRIRVIRSIDRRNQNFSDLVIISWFNLKEFWTMK